jgi:hypothetical protein
LPRRSRRHEFDPEIKELLVVAGLSGCGKSTFITQIKRRRLPHDIARLFPSDIHNWHHVPGKKSWKDRWIKNRAKPRGQILHFDVALSEIYFRWLAETGALPAHTMRETHPEEETLHTALAAAEKIRVVLIKPTKEQLITQLSGRAMVTDLSPRFRPIASRIVPSVAHASHLVSSRRDSAFRIRLGSRWAKRAEDRIEKFQNCEFYSRDDTIDAVHRTWKDFVERKIGSRFAAPIAYVEPEPDTILRRKFRLARGVADETADV